MNEEQIRMIIRDELQELLASDRYIFHKTIQLLDGRNIQLATGTGTKIGTASGQKLAFFGVTPVDQPETVNDPDGTLNDATQKIKDIIDRLQELGIIK